MNIYEVVNFLGFWINKATGAWYTVDELIAVIDRGQMALYSDLKPKYATSQLVKDALSPFRADYEFTPTVTISGYIVVPYNSGYLDLLDLQIQVNISTRIIYWSVPMVNEDEISDRLNSQIDPVTVTNPVGEQKQPRFFKLYPLSGYTGTVKYFSRPVKPVLGYTTISGRVIVYDEDSSVQLQWRETEIVPLLLKALESLGINLSDAEVSQFSQLKTYQNYQGINRL